MCASSTEKNSQFLAGFGAERRTLLTNSQPVARRKSRVAKSQAQVSFNDMPIVVAIKIFVINYKYVEIAAAATA